MHSILHNGLETCLENVLLLVFHRSFLSGIRLIKDVVERNSSAQKNLYPNFSVSKSR